MGFLHMMTEHWLSDVRLEIWLTYVLEHLRLGFLALFLLRGFYWFVEQIVQNPIPDFIHCVILNARICVHDFLGDLGVFELVQSKKANQRRDDHNLTVTRQPI